MTDSIDTGALLARAFRLPHGRHVRLRLVHRSDLPALRSLLERKAVEHSEVALERLVRYDPTRRVAVCATALIGAREEIVGVGAIPIEAGADPDTLVVDDRLGPGVAELLDAALRHRADRSARRVA
jgi:hypothetical protein